MRRGDTLVVLDLSRLGRDTRELLAIVEDDLHAKGRHFRALDGIVLDTSDDMWGELVFTVFAAIAKFQRQQSLRAPSRDSTPPAPGVGSADAPAC
ncbi:recombinase family protein [Dactylosporangium sp. NPDC006015]|uniref:recombinase family protein n=1 Tax=Dactylosporangium sp. NPDC006015 TaxID=3154576 RepID=UPI0033A277FE